MLLRDIAAESAVTAPRRGRGALIGGGAVILAAFALRIWRLGVQSFWWDEAYSTIVSREGLREIVATLAREDYHPPLHYFLLHYWMILVGQSEFALRYLSVMAGLLAVAAAWTTATRFFGHRAAPIVASLFTASPYLWYYDRENRMFALVPLFSVLAVYCCARAAEERRARWWLGYAAAVAFGLYDLYYALFLPFVCGLWLLMIRWPFGTAGEASRRQRIADLVRWAVATLAALLVYLPWIPIFVGRAAVWTSAFTPDNGPIKVVTWSWTDFVLGLPTLGLYQQLVPAALLGTSAVGTIVALGWAWSARQRNSGALLVALAFLGPLLAMAAISAIKPVFHPRYAMPVVAGLYLLLGGFLHWLGSGTSVIRKAAGGALAVALVASIVVGLDQLNVDPNYARDDYRGAIAYVSAGLKPGDAIIHNATPPFDYYYHGSAPASYFPTRPYSESNVADELNADTQGHPRLWYVMNLTIPNDPDHFVDTQLRLHAKLLDEHQFGALRIQLWQIPADLSFGQVNFNSVAVNLANQFAITGYAASGDPLGGQTLDVEMTIQTRAKPAADDGFWVALVDPSGQQWGRGDARPYDAAYRLTSGWTPGESSVIRMDLPVAVGTPPGTYQLVAGAYRLNDLAGLNVLDANQHPIGQQADLGLIAVSKVTTDRTDPLLNDQRATPVAPGLVLLADQVEPTSARPGDQIQVTLLWKATGQLPPLRSVLDDRTANGTQLASREAPIGGAFPTDRWPVGAVVREQEHLTLPATATAGPTKLVLDVADADSGAAVGSPLTLATLNVAGVARQFSQPASPHPLDLTFGQLIGLAGYDLSSATVHPGDNVTLTLDWHSIRQTTTSYHVFVHLLDGESRMQSQWDGVPRNWAYPTSAWLPGEFVRDQYVLTIPSNEPAGTLTLEVGLYDAADGKRLTVASAKASGNGDDHVILQTLRVVP